MLVNEYGVRFPIMAETGYPVCYDATHSIQLPTSMGSVSGGQREYIPYLVRAAVACGVNALFMEVHDDPIMRCPIPIQCWTSGISIVFSARQRPCMNFDWNYSINTEKTMSTRKNETIRVNEVMLTLDRFPVIPEREILKETLEAMNRFRLGIACIVDSRNRLLGIITDGDIRRKLLALQKPVSAFFRRRRSRSRDQNPCDDKPLTYR